MLTKQLQGTITLFIRIHGEVQEAQKTFEKQSHVVSLIRYLEIQLCGFVLYKERERE